MVKKIELSQGYVATIDDDDYAKVSRFNWHINGTTRGAPYAICYFTEDGQRKHYLMHRFIMNTQPHMETDHINGDRLDNRKENLRVCTKAENRRNSKVSKKTKSGFKGVVQVGERWRAGITFNKKTRYLGTYDSAPEAARAYDEAAIKHFGDFASTNF